MKINMNMNHFLSIKLRNSFLIFVVLLTGSLPVTAQEINTSKLDEYLTLLETNNKFMGSVSILKNNDIVYNKAYGYENIADKKRATRDTKYFIGSISKTFTATLIMKAVESGKLKLNQNVAAFYPELSNSEKITIDNLLRHKSGVKSITSLPGYYEWRTENKSRKNLVDLILSLEPVFEPGSRFEYSNSGYVLLTFILEDIYGQPFSNILKNEIITPLKLKNTVFTSNLQGVSHLAASYEYREGWIMQEYTNPSIPLGAGGILSTASDLSMFSNALFSGKIISNGSLEILKKSNSRFGAGLIQLSFYERKSYGHTGGIDGYQSLFSHFDDEEIDVVILGNGVNMNFNNISIAVLSAVFGKPFSFPSFNEIELSTEELNSYPGTFSSSKIAIKLVFKVENEELIVRASGQQPLKLEPTAERQFEYEEANLKILFDADKNGLELYQKGAKIYFKRDQ